MRVGYLLNITHAIPIVAIEEGLFDEYKVQHFVSGGYLLNSLMSNNIDIAYIGPGPFINAINKGLELKLLSLSAVGANSLIVNKGYKADKNYEIKRIAVPQFGNTQDLIARNFVTRMSNQKHLSSKMPSDFLKLADELMDARTLKFSKEIEFIAINPAELEPVLIKGYADAALVAEPWGSFLEEKGFVNLNAWVDKKNLVTSLEDQFESKLKQEMKIMNSFPATLLVVRKDYYETHKKEVAEFLLKQDYILDLLALDPESTIYSIQEHFKRIAGKEFSEEMIADSLMKIDFNSEMDYQKLSDLEDVAIVTKYIRKKQIVL